MKVIIIGADGMLGQELAKVFSEENCLLWDIKQIDITDKDQVLSKIKAERPDLVINSAAYNDVDGAEQNEALANKINGYAVGYLAEAVRNAEGILVHYSTDYVFKGDNKDGYKEFDAPDPQSAYARSKYLGEQELQKNIKDYYLIRLSKLFGKPANSKISKKSFVDTMLTLAQTKKEIDVIDEELSCPTYAPDLAQRTKEIVSKKMPFGIYHAANSGANTWFQFTQEIFKIKNIDVKLNPVSGNSFPRAAVRPRYSVLLNTKMNLMRSWQDTLEDHLKNV